MKWEKKENPNAEKLKKRKTELRELNSERPSNR
jgi:hypothetical protein